MGIACAQTGLGLGYEEILGCWIGQKIAFCDTEAVAQETIVR